MRDITQAVESASECSDPMCVFQRIGKHYLALASMPRFDRDKAWAPPRTRYSQFKKLLGLMPSIRRRLTKIGNHEIHYWDAGSQNKPPVILIHGFSAGKENWLNTVLLLKRHFRFLVPDVPGFGENNFLPSEDYRLDPQAARIFAWFETLGIEKAHWTGSSMGGALAGIIAARHPKCLASLVLMNNGGGLGSELSPFERGLLQGRNSLIPESYAEVAKVFKLAAERHSGFLSRIYPPLVARDQIDRAPIYHRLFHDMMTSSGHSSYAWAERVACSTLIIWGDSDRVLHPSAANVLHKLIPGSNLKILRDVGHLPMLEAPFTTGRILRNFWEQDLTIFKT